MTKEESANVFEQCKAKSHATPILQTVSSPVFPRQPPFLRTWLQATVHSRTFGSFPSLPCKRLQNKECNALTRSRSRSRLFQRRQKHLCRLTPIRTIGKPTLPTHLTERPLHRYVSSESKYPICLRSSVLLHLLEDIPVQTCLKARRRVGQDILTPRSIRKHGLLS